jgi:hypothetical protein
VSTQDRHAGCDDDIEDQWGRVKSGHVSGLLPFDFEHELFAAFLNIRRERINPASAPARIVSTASAAHQRPAIGEGLRIHESLRSLQALQHSVHARTRPPLASPEAGPTAIKFLNCAGMSMVAVKANEALG